jgi:hypothetical protein
VNYLVEVFDTWGRRVAQYDDVPLLEATVSTPDQRRHVRGALPWVPEPLGHGYRVRVSIDGQPFCEAPIDRLAPHWGDQRRLVLDRYVNVHELNAFEAQTPLDEGNTSVIRAYTNREISDIVKDAINTANGPVHYTVAHEAYPQGAEREFQKFEARKTAENELAIAGIASGQWVGADRIDTSGAYAIDGDTIAGLVVDGVVWPDLRLMMVDCEEMSRNSHAISRHPEIAAWTSDAYARSGYHLKAEAARVALQDLLDTHGLDFIELNPHRDLTGAYDDRVDAYDRYVGLLYGGGQCFNAALVELGHSEVYLYADGAYHVPEMALKEYFSYPGVHGDSIAATGVTLTSFSIDGGVFEALTALSYAADGAVWHADADLKVTFRQPTQPDRGIAFDPLRVGVSVGSDSTDLANILYFDGNPFHGALEKTYFQSDSIDIYGSRARHLEYFGISLEEDADKLCAGVLEDVAYPEPVLEVTFFSGCGDLTIGELVELRDGPLRRLDLPADSEWGGRFAGRIIGRVNGITHQIYGRRIVTTVQLGSPLRSVRDPIAYMTRSQPSKETIYQFRLDDTVIGLDMGYHLD